MGIITISRQIGAGETTIAPAVAEKLGWECVDNKLLDRQVEETGIKLPDVVHHDEHAPGILESWQRPREAERYFQALRKIVMEYAEHGNVVIVGRGANFILSDADAIHSRLIADMPSRIRRVMDIRWVNDGPAREIIRQSDHDRAGIRNDLGTFRPDSQVYHSVAIYGAGSGGDRERGPADDDRADMVSAEGLHSG